jgi:hypothetical protein
MQTVIPDNKLQAVRARFLEEIKATNESRRQMEVRFFVISPCCLRNRPRARGLFSLTRKKWTRLHTRSLYIRQPATGRMRGHNNKQINDN